MLKPFLPFTIGMFCRSTFFGTHLLHRVGLSNTEIMVGKTLFCEFLSNRIRTTIQSLTPSDILTGLQDLQEGQVKWRVAGSG
jgi:hypothetical protein